MSRQATKADNPLGSTKQEQIRLAVEARESHRSADADLNDVHMRFQAAPSSPEGPAVLTVCIYCGPISVYIPTYCHY